jgi:DNA-binding MarR family transcriptional regulator
VARLEDLQRVEKAIVRIARIGGGRDAARNRAERSGVFLSRPAISIISALHASGPVRLSHLSDLTDLEAPLVSREIAQLSADGYVKRASDPTDGRATIVSLSAKGRRAYVDYRKATDDIVVEAFAGWRAGELRTLADYLERVVVDVSRPPHARQP